MGGDEGKRRRGPLNNEGLRAPENDHVYGRARLRAHGERRSEHGCATPYSGPAKEPVQPVIPCGGRRSKSGSRAQGPINTAIKR